MKLKLKTLDLERTPIELTVYPDPRNKGVKAVFDRNGVAEVPDRIGVILLKDNSAYERMPDDYASTAKSEPEPEKKKKEERKPKSVELPPSEGADADKAGFMAQIK